MRRNHSTVALCHHWLSMASSVQNLFKRPQVTTIIASLKNSQTYLAAPRVVLQPHLTDAKPDDRSSYLVPNPILEFPRSQNLTAPGSSLFFPTFPFGFSLKPVSSTGSSLSEPEDDVSADSGTMWADSVKKKRKKKMNKHKFKKLRKILRRKS